MQHSSSSEDVDMESSGVGRSDSCGSVGVVSSDADGGSIDELSAKFSVQGTSSSKSTGKKKVVCVQLLWITLFLAMEGLTPFNIWIHFYFRPLKILNF